MRTRSFPSPPALSPRERENRRQSLLQPGRSASSRAGMRNSLSPREGARGEGNDVLSIGTDLAVSLVSQVAETNGAVRVIAQVQNLGAPSATNSALAIRRAGQTNAPLATVAVPLLEPGRLAQVALDLAELVHEPQLRSSRGNEAQTSRKLLAVRFEVSLVTSTATGQSAGFVTQQRGDPTRS